MKFKELVFSIKYIIYFYIAVFIVSEIILFFVQQKCNLFSDQYYLMMVADNYFKFYLSLLVFSLLTIIHYVLPRKANIPLLSNQIYVLMMPYIFLFAFYLNGFISICFCIVHFYNNWMQFFFFGTFTTTYFVLIIVTTMVGRLSMNRNVWGVEYNG
jgi:hypothetical protein